MTSNDQTKAVIQFMHTVQGSLHEEEIINGMIK